MRDFAKGTQRYLVVTAIFGAVVAVLDSGALWLLGVPLPLTWGLLSFLTNFIPNIGFVLGVVSPALLALLEGGPEVGVIVVYFVLNVVIQTYRRGSSALGRPRPDDDVPGAGLLGLRRRPARRLLAVPRRVRATFVDGRPGAVGAGADRLAVHPAGPQERVDTESRPGDPSPAGSSETSRPRRTTVRGRSSAVMSVGASPSTTSRSAARPARNRPVPPAQPDRARGAGRWPTRGPARRRHPPRRGHRPRTGGCRAAWPG